MSSCAAERGISVTRFGTTIFVRSVEAKDNADFGDCVQDAPTIAVAIYICIRHVSRDVRSLPQSPLRPWIVDGKLYVHPN